MHACPVPSCSIKVPSHMFMCARHWRMVPKPLQAAIYEFYSRDGRAGQNHFEAIKVVKAAEAGRATLTLPAGTKALTIWQPWASLIIMGAKPYEFRRWNFADKPHLAKLIGQRVVVHAGARPMRTSELDDLLARIDEGESTLVSEIAGPFVRGLRAACKGTRVGAAPLAVALGTATIGEPRNVVDLFKDMVADSDRLDEHMYAWPLRDIVAFPAPIPASGAQGFWNWS